MSVEQQITSILERHLSGINARVLLDKAIRASKLTSGRLERRQIGQLVTTLGPSIRLFLDAREATEIIQALGKLSAPVDEPRSLRVDVAKEADILVARQAARNLCTQASAGSFTSTRVLTVVNELGRNMVSYSVGGWLELDNQGDGIAVTACDAGPGIANLDEILSGRYVSRTGLGLGLLGVRKLSKEFSIVTAETGTTIKCKVSL